MKLLRALLLGSLAACASVVPKEERAEMFRLDVKPVAGTNGAQLEVSGRSLQSALVVDHVDVTTQGDTMMVHVYVALASSLHDGTGDFSRTITVPPEVRRVAFGEEQTVIWERGP